jgi:hypothetical protein
VTNSTRLARGRPQADGKHDSEADKAEGRPHEETRAHYGGLAFGAFVAALNWMDRGPSAPWTGKNFSRQHRRLRPEGIENFHDLRAVGRCTAVCKATERSSVFLTLPVRIASAGGWRF